MPSCKTQEWDPHLIISFLKPFGDLLVVLQMKTKLLLKAFQTFQICFLFISPSSLAHHTPATLIFCQFSEHTVFSPSPVLPNPFGPQRKCLLKQVLLNLQTRLGPLISWRLLLFSILLLTHYLCDPTWCLPLLAVRFHEGIDPIVLSHGWSCP